MICCSIFQKPVKKLKKVNLVSSDSSQNIITHQKEKDVDNMQSSSSNYESAVTTENEVVLQAHRKCDIGNYVKNPEFRKVHFPNLAYIIKFDLHKLHAYPVQGWTG